ncbi:MULTISPECIES: serine hydrolase [Pedobacter]|uniref:Beta-lactamase n=1 Tax=Pedobacter heparinus (strain ATCC 13125 / DSM 2366 / CIP 104194 / JCM 7457 / NBRC 12017 / NCIMB 9290 / NRRL B-14731 / HIM 762-3) TaxID=485917 RepID=C6Y376_PEDHD|nr:MULTISPECIES: serine hydrolase [Pedobacter]ACU05301.1 beta-lactamase [Pedobacter heparinus DSM 2366]MBB5439565.1 beta-lactamase class A [Pedobacter sp. AK017]
MKQILIALLLFPVLAFAQQIKTDHKLEKELNTLISGFKGTVGIYTMNLKTGKQAGIYTDSIFPTASIVKVPILIGLFDKIEKGELSYHQPLMYRDSIKYGGSGIMQFFKDSSATELSVLANLMMTYSDNTTSLWNQRLAGGGARINEVLEQYGFKDTRVNSRTKGREAIWKIYGWGQTTPREMATLLVKIRKGEIISKAASERMYRLMTKGYYDENALAQIPPYVQAAAKSGAVNESRSEVVLVNAPHGDYVFYVGTKNIKDQSWTPDNEAEQLIRKVSALLWKYYEPAGLR